MTRVLDIVFGYRNRSAERVYRCLESLKNQTYKDFNVIFVDYGSDEQIRKEIELLVKQYEFCQYVFNQTQGWPWNRSHALNTGVRFTNSEYIMTSDVDLIFSERFLEFFVQKLAFDKEVHSRFYFLPKSFRSWNKLKQLPTDFKLSSRRFLGAVMSVHREQFDKIGGFDEYFQFYGAEDIDISERLQNLGVEKIWFDQPEFPVYHQWHPVVLNDKSKSIDRHWRRINKQYLASRKTSIQSSNARNWGRVYTKESRPSLNFIKEPGENLLIDLSGHLPVYCYQELCRLCLPTSKHESIRVIFCLKDSKDYKASRRYKLITYFNKLANALKVPVRLTDVEAYYQNRHSLYEIKYAFHLFLHTYKSKYVDYHLRTFEDRIELILIG